MNHGMLPKHKTCSNLRNSVSQYLREYEIIYPTELLVIIIIINNEEEEEIIQNSVLLHPIHSVNYIQFTRQ